MKLSVLIATRDRPDELHRCLSSIEKQDYTPDEIVVLDNNSSEPLRLATYSVSDRIKSIVSTKRLGVAESRNLLLAAANGELCLVLDDDAWFEQTDALSMLLQHFADPIVGAVAMRIENHVGDKVVTLAPFTRSRRGRNPDLIETTQKVSYFIGGGFCLRRSILATTGNFDPAFEYAHEELDLSFRIINSGFSILYTPDVTVHHLSPITDSAELKKRRFFHHPKNRIHIARKYLKQPQKFSYLTIWFSKYAIESIKEKELGSIFKAIRVSSGEQDRIKPVTLKPSAMKYLKRHHGRYWY